MPPAAALTALAPSEQLLARRIGFSGPPGAGKSTLIATWSKHLLELGRSMGVLAVDPSSPLSSGSLLGDRIRMDHVTDHKGFFLRSVPSRSVHDGLCPNVACMLDAMEHDNFDDIVLETVGVGQTDYAARSLVDAFVVILNPETGDVIQAMKAGILEVADVLVVNKADMQASKRMHAELKSVITRLPADSQPALVSVSAISGMGIGELDEAITTRASRALSSRPARIRARTAYKVRSALLASIDAALLDAPNELWDESASVILRRVLLQVATS